MIEYIYSGIDHTINISNWAEKSRKIQKNTEKKITVTLQKKDVILQNKKDSYFVEIRHK